MTNVYFVRHAQPNYENHDDLTRELTEKGLQDRKLVTEFLRDTVGVDLFPCCVDIHGIVSNHVETVCLLSRNK